MTIKPILLPGINAPEFTLPAVNREHGATVSHCSAGVTILLFLGSEMTKQTVSRLLEFQEREKDYRTREARLVGLTDAPAEEMKKLVLEKEIEFPVLATAQAVDVADRYGVLGEGRAILPAVFVVDQEGLIRRVFSPDPDEELPNPAMVLRAVNNLSYSPKPPLLRSDDWRLGPAAAPLTFLEYGDYQCGHCRDLFGVIRELMPSYQDKIQFVFRHFPMRHAHPWAVMAAQAAEAAGAQGKFWDMHARLFAADNALERANLLLYAREIGLDMDKFAADLTSKEMENSVMDEYREATRYKIKSPPTLFVNNILFDGPQTIETLRNKIEELLACLE